MWHRGRSKNLECIEALSICLRVVFVLSGGNQITNDEPQMTLPIFFQQFAFWTNISCFELCWVDNHPDVWSEGELSFFSVISVKSFGHMNITSAAVRQLSGKSGQE